MAAKTSLPIKFSVCVDALMVVFRVVICNFRWHSLHEFIIQISTVTAVSAWTYYDHSGHRHWRSV